ncbi:MAG TPA: transketolase [Elusimicrobiota bacterium]|nr:transketolase [Elusimicrobiota bacterium]
MTIAAEKPTSSSLDRLAIDTIRFLSVDAVEKADSGHPGLPLGAAPMAYALWTRFLRHNPANPQWFDRDRFLLSAGHGSMLLYSLLHLTGYDLPMEELKRFRQWGSRTPGHPERGLTPGVEITTGPLGQGFGNGVGAAMGEAALAARFNRPGFPIVDHYTYGIVSDGDLMEGVASEAASLAGHLKLGKLIYLWDDNRVTLSAGTASCFTEDVGARFRAYGWHTAAVEDGNDVEAVDAALRAAQKERERPSLIAVRTHIGFGSPKQDSFESHGSPLGADAVKKTKQKLGWPLEPAFLVPEEAGRRMRRALERGAEMEAEWNGLLSRYETAHPDAAREFRRALAGELPEGWDAEVPSFPADAKGLATRAAGGKVLTALAARIPEIIGGSADLNPSTKTELKGAGDFESPARAPGDLQGLSGGGCSYAGRNLHFGVREHAMGAALNGLAAHGCFIPYGATFLTFSDYMRPSIRLAALSGLRVIYVFTHDSLGLGEDGPTHQSVEHVAALRAIPNLLVIRPGDANETAEAWRIAVETTDRPIALILSRQNVPTLDRSRFAAASGTRSGAYVLSDPGPGKARALLIATGSELGLIVEAERLLKERGVAVRLVSMPSWELFAAQPQDYRDSVLPPELTARVSVEAGVTQGWCRWVGDRGTSIGVDRFGESAPGPTVLREFGFTAENVRDRTLALLK